MGKPTTDEQAGGPNGVGAGGFGPASDGGFAFALPPGVIFDVGEGAEDAAGLLVCPDCGSELMHPTGCEEQGQDRWWLELRCAECGGSRSSVFDLDMLDELDTELEIAEAEIEADLKRLTDANMLEYATRFISALNAGAIDPVDFAT